MKTSALAAIATKRAALFPDAEVVFTTKVDGADVGYSLDTMKVEAEANDEGVLVATTIIAGKKFG